MNATKTAATPKAPAKTYVLPKGYEAKWTKPGYDLLKRTASAKGDGPAWYVTCNTHGQMTEAKSAKDGDSLGTTKARATWCSGDHSKPVTAKKAPTTAPAKKSTTSKAPAKKATTSKAPAKKVTAKKATTKKASAPAEVKTA